MTGRLTFVAGSGGHGVKVTVKLSGFEGELGPYGYHIHDQPVPTDGNCTGTKAHLDPYGRGQVTPCDASKPETCEVGDLAGKHGKIPASENGKPHSIRGSVERALIASHQVLLTTATRTPSSTLLPRRASALSWATVRSSFTATTLTRPV